MVVARQALLVLVALAVINGNEAAGPFFLQAITSALGTIPFTAGPMTTGLVGAKLAVGSKLLYYLGFFGRRRSKPKPKPAPVKASRPKQQRLGSGGGSKPAPGGMQAVPLPYAFGGGGFPQGGGGFSMQGGGGFPQQGFPMQGGGFPQQGFPMQSGGGFPQQFGGGGFPQQFGGGFPQQSGGGNPAFGQFPHGYDPAQLFQMMTAQGIDPATAMQAMNYDGGAGAQAVPSSQFPFPPGGGAGSPDLNMPSENHVSDQDSGQAEGGSENEVESFFTFLRDMDDNSCISRLMCDIGADPSFLGEFSENIHGIIGSLDVLPSSGAFQYIAIMESGRSEGGCAQKFPQCGDTAYEIVKNVAPSVGMPQNINSETVNQL